MSLLDAFGDRTGGTQLTDEGFDSCTRQTEHLQIPFGLLLRQLGFQVQVVVALSVFGLVDCSRSPSVQDCITALAFAS